MASIEATESFSRGVLDADDARIKAMLTPDADALGTYLATDLIYTHSSGRTDRASDIVDAVRCGRVRYLSVERNVLSLAHWGGVTAVNGAISIKLVRAGIELSVNSLFLAVWIVVDNRHVLWRWASTAQAP